DRDDRREERRARSLPRLRLLRERQALSQHDLAERAGVGKSTILMLECSRRGAYPKTIRRLAEALATTPDVLIGLESADNMANVRHQPPEPQPRADAQESIARFRARPGVDRRRVAELTAHIPRTRTEIDAAFAAMADDTEYQVEARSEPGPLRCRRRRALRRF